MRILPLLHPLDDSGLRRPATEAGEPKDERPPLPVRRRGAALRRSGGATA